MSALSRELTDLRTVYVAKNTVLFLAGHAAERNQPLMSANIIAKSEDGDKLLAP